MFQAIALNTHDVMFSIKQPSDVHVLRAPIDMISSTKQSSAMQRAPDILGMMLFSM